MDKPAKWAQDVGNSWRTTPDIADNYRSMVGTIDMVKTHRISLVVIHLEDDLIFLCRITIMQKQQDLVVGMILTVNRKIETFFC